MTSGSEMAAYWLIVAHLLGDYVFQNNWMGVEKTKRWFPAIVHAVLYTAAFAIFFGFCWALIPIGVTHLVIDRYSLVKRYWVDFWGIGKTGWLPGKFGVQMENAPPFIGLWLAFIADNTIHLVINGVSLLFLG